MGEYLPGHQDAERVWHQHKLLQGAIGMVGGEQARQRQHRRKQRSDPDHAGGDGAQQRRLRPYAQRKQAHYDREEK